MGQVALCTLVPTNKKETHQAPKTEGPLGVSHCRGHPSGLDRCYCRRCSGTHGPDFHPRLQQNIDGNSGGWCAPIVSCNSRSRLLLMEKTSTTPPLPPYF